jgi:hypothetical protein
LQEMGGLSNAMRLSQNDAAGLCSGMRVMKVILRQALIAIYVATTVVALADFFIWMANNGQPAPETQQTPTAPDEGQ